jgi:hypothetical protein
MTSSFSLPGGTFAARNLFRAESVISVGKEQAEFTTFTQSRKVQTRWVYLGNTASPEAVAPIPPTREADYVGQVIAVASPVTSAQV